MKSIGILILLIFASLISAGIARAQSPVEIGSRRELFVDYLLVDSLDKVSLQMHRPCDEGSVFAFDKPWEGVFCAYVTIIHADGKYQAYYRGAGNESTSNTGDHQVLCYAESTDGIRWTKPELDLFPLDGSPRTNVILAHVAPDTHNFSPFIDTKPGVSADEKYKAIGGYNEPGLSAYVSPDGIHWKKLQDKPVLTKEQAAYVPGMKSLVFDSQNVPFWSEAEQKYLLYYRVYKDKNRRIARVESDDFVHWRNPALMEYRHGDGPAPIEQLYTNQTHPYFRAPQIYISTAARFMLGRQVLTTQQAEEIQVNPRYFHDTSDAVLMTSRGGNIYDRTFMEAFVSPGIGATNWVSRTNYPALNVVQTGPNEMSVYVNQNYGQPTSHLRRYSMRLDGFASVHADYDGGEMRTKPLIFSGSKLFLNFATSAAGGMRVEVQDAEGHVIPGFALDDCHEVIGNEIERDVSWKGGSLAGLAGKAVRLRFVMKDADLYAIRFGDNVKPD
ncbi:MAG TPA: hypothetical protein VFE58_06045 [Tepidisphaeraceae bacterium]|jgi:hypothetical protein|nr:hypothetical protein [Tepidisphaeraceae bacterium]